MTSFAIDTTITNGNTYSAVNFTARGTQSAANDMLQIVMPSGWLVETPLSFGYNTATFTDVRGFSVTSRTFRFPTIVGTAGAAFNGLSHSDGSFGQVIARTGAITSTTATDTKTRVNFYGNDAAACTAHFTIDWSSVVSSTLAFDSSNVT